MPSPSPTARCTPHRSIAVEDLDGDGYPDVVATFHLESATWFKNVDGLGGFSTGYDIATGSNGWSGVTAADVDGDGDFDVVTASRGDGTCSFRTTLFF